MLRDLFSLFPAHAGVIPVMKIESEPKYAFPRTRGGDPNAMQTINSAKDFSPHTRG